MNDLHQHDEPETEEERILGSLWIISDRGPARGEKKQVQTLWESHVAMDAYNQMYIYISVPVHTYIYIYINGRFNGKLIYKYWMFHRHL